MSYRVVFALTLCVGLGNRARCGVIVDDLGFPICVQMRVSYLANNISKGSQIEVALTCNKPGVFQCSTSSRTLGWVGYQQLSYKDFGFIHGRRNLEKEPRSASSVVLQREQVGKWDSSCHNSVHNTAQCPNIDSVSVLRCFCIQTWHIIIELRRHVFLSASLCPIYRPVS
jgi:hypothetical protein